MFPPIGPYDHHHPPMPGPIPLGGSGTWAGLQVASGWARLASLSIDVVACSVIGNTVLGSESVFWWLMIANSIVLQGFSGQSLGKVLMGMHLVMPVKGFGPNYPIGESLGVIRSAVRGALHVIDVLLFPVAFFFVLGSEKRQFFADRLMGTVCLHTAEKSKVAFMQTVN